MKISDYAQNDIWNNFKKFNNAFKAETFKFKFNKNKNKNETKLKKSNKISTSNNIEKKKLTYINCDYYKRQHSQSCFYKHSEFAEEKWWKIMKSSATTSTRADFNTNLLETLKIQVNNQILMLHDSHYNLNTVTNLIFFEMLE